MKQLYSIFNGRSDLCYRCLKKLKDKFVEELMTKYGETALSKLKKETKEEKIKINITF